MDFLEKILVEKQVEVERMPLEAVERSLLRPSFYKTVQQTPDRMHVIAEIKRASPSKGAINQEVDILSQASSYEAAGVSAISILTDPTFFDGSIEDLRAISQKVKLPLLCKDFIISKKQLIRAKNAGASMVLLIVAALSESALAELFHQATDLGLEVLVEVHDAKELAQAEALGAPIIGVNNRNLKTFQVSLDTSIQLAPKKEKTVYISESGFKTAEDVAKVAPYFSGVLVGESLMLAKDVTAYARELQVARR